MILKRLSILNYKNIREATIELSPKINCLIGQNGVGKTNFLDAVYYLSFCRSAFTPIDSQVIMHDQDFFVLDGDYRSDRSISSATRKTTSVWPNTSGSSRWSLSRPPTACSLPGAARSAGD